MNDIDALVKATIQTKILEAFRSTPEIIDELVKAATLQEVNNYGSKPDYHDKKMPYLTWITQETIRGIVTKAVIEHLASMTEQIKEAVRARLSAEDMVNAFAKQIVAAASQEYRLKIVFDSEDGR